MRTTLLIAGYLAICAAELVLFTRYYDRCFASFHPLNWDQSPTIVDIYTANSDLDTDGIATLMKPSSSIYDCAMKGISLQYVGLTNLRLFGESRLSLSLINIVFLFVGQTALAWFLYNRWGVAGAMSGIGFLLLSGTHYFWAGGLDDLRFDYSGMTILGTGFLACVSYFERPSASNWIIAILAIALVTLTRSIAIVYLIGMVGISLVCDLLLATLLGNKPKLMENLVSDCRLLAGIVVVCISFFALHWKSVSEYYLNCVSSGESTVRWLAEGSGNDIQSRIDYYASSFGDHFSTIFRLLLVLSAAALVVLVINRVRRAPASSDQNFQYRLFLLAGALFLSVVLPCLSYGPSPLVIGVLTVPMAAIAAAAMSSLFRIAGNKWVMVSASVLVLSFGMLRYTRELSTEASAKVDLAFESQLARHLASTAKILDETKFSKQPVVAWMLIHDAFIPSVLEIYEIEHELPFTKIHSQMGAVHDVTNETIDVMLTQDVVITYSKTPTQSSHWPFDQHREDTRSRWEPKLNDDYVKLVETEFPSKGYSVGTYVKKTHLGTTTETTVQKESSPVLR